jgi:hypothetical protein
MPLSALLFLLQPRININIPRPDPNLAAVLVLLDRRDKLVYCVAHGGGIEHHELHDLAILVEPLNDLALSEVKVTI